MEPDNAFYKNNLQLVEEKLSQGQNPAAGSMGGADAGAGAGGAGAGGFPGGTAVDKLLDNCLNIFATSITFRHLDQLSLLHSPKRIMGQLFLVSIFRAGTHGKC